MSKKILVWDLGATKCDIGLVEQLAGQNNFRLITSCNIKIKNCTSLENLILQAEQQLQIKHNQTDAICIGAAGIYNGQVLEHDNSYPFPMPFAALAKKFQWPQFEIIHDYAPILCATFLTSLNNPNFKSLNNVNIDPYARRTAVGIGTGLGLKDGVLFPDGSFWMGSNEMGHIGLSAPIATSEKFLMLHRKLTLKSNFSFEKILSGQGLLRLHQLLHPDNNFNSPESVGELIQTGQASETLSLFAFYLGLFIGTVQLCFMPAGGIWITGGVILKHLEVFDQPEFYQGIESLPAYLKQRQKFAIFVLSEPNQAFMGGAYYVSKRFK